MLSKATRSLDGTAEVRFSIFLSAFHRRRGNPPEQIFASTVKIQIRRASMCEKIYRCCDLNQKKIQK